MDTLEKLNIEIAVKIYLFNQYFTFILLIITEKLSLKCKTFDSKLSNSETAGKMAIAKTMLLRCVQF